MAMQTGGPTGPGGIQRPEGPGKEKGVVKSGKPLLAKIAGGVKFNFQKLVINISHVFSNVSLCSFNRLRNELNNISSENKQNHIDVSAFHEGRKPEYKQKFANKMLNLSNYQVKRLYDAVRDSPYKKEILESFTETEGTSKILSQSHEKASNEDVANQLLSNQQHK